MLNLDKSKKYLLACSFGPDSMALFDMLKKQGYNFMVAHVNYGVRNEAENETANLNQYCADEDIEIEIYYCKGMALIGNFEAKAREVRYKFFKEIYDSHHLDGLIVGHQQDDVLETYYLQRKRGGFVEKYGILSSTNIYGMNVYRPLLDYSKQELLDYCNNNHVPYAIDSSNLLEDFQRNIIRLNIVSKMNPRERAKLLEEINEMNKDIDLIYKKIFSLNLKSVKDLLTLNDEELQRALIYQARQIELDASISSKLSSEIRKILLSDKPNIQFKIHKGLIFIKEYDWCNFSDGTQEELYSFTLDGPQLFETQYFYLDFRTTSRAQNVTLDDYPITIRSPKEDDSIQINNYKSELRRLFIDWKMPASLRKRWPVIVNKNQEVIYVPRYRKDFKISEGLNFYVKF